MISLIKTWKNWASPRDPSGLGPCSLEKDYVIYIWKEEFDGNNKLNSGRSILQVH